VTKSGASAERKALENQGPVRTNRAGLLFKQAVGSAHRAAVDIKFHSEIAATSVGDRQSPVKALGATLNARPGLCAYHIPPRATVIASPFTPPAASLQRNAITCATSRGSSTRFGG